jgi:hypothetical protein
MHTEFFEAVVASVWSSIAIVNGGDAYVSGNETRPLSEHRPPGVGL